MTDAQTPTSTARDSGKRAGSASAGRSLVQPSRVALGGAVTAIWAATAVVALAGPDMVTGSAHEHLPIGAMTAWIWATAATVYVGMAARVQSGMRNLAVAVSVTWVLVAGLALAAPELVTGTDPTRVPVAAFVSPIAGACVTAYLALRHVLSNVQTWPDGGSAGE